MNSLMHSPDLVARNRFFGQVQSSWEKAYKQAMFLPKNEAPLKLIYLSREQLFLDKNYLSSSSSRNFFILSSTKFQARIKNTGFRRIYKGIQVLGCVWLESQKKFFRTTLGECDTYYYFVEIDHEPVVVIFNFDHPYDIDEMPIR